MKKPQEKYEEVFMKDCYSDRVINLREELINDMPEVKQEILDELIELVYCSGFIDGFEESKFYYRKVYL